MRTSQLSVILHSQNKLFEISEIGKDHAARGEFDGCLQGDQHQSELKTAMAKEAASDALKHKGYALHGLGVDMAEGAPKSFQAGNVLCYEPQLTSGNQAFFVEDTFLITAAGHEVINPALPYSPGDIERSMNQSSPQSK